MPFEDVVLREWWYRRDNGMRRGQDHTSSRGRGQGCLT